MADFQIKLNASELQTGKGLDTKGQVFIFLDLTNVSKRTMLFRFL